MNRRDFLHLFGCGCMSFGLSSCSSTPITERKQLKLVPEAKLNAQAAAVFEKIKEKEKLSPDIKTLNEIKEIIANKTIKENFFSLFIIFFNIIN